MRPTSTVLGFSWRILHTIICDTSRGCFPLFSNSAKGAVNECNSELRDVRPGPPQGQPQEARARRHSASVQTSSGQPSAPAPVGRDIGAGNWCWRLAHLHICTLERQPRRGGLPEERGGDRGRQRGRRSGGDRREGGQEGEETRRQDAVHRQRMGRRVRNRPRGGEGGREVQTP